jgi:hypothetical protein
VRAARLHLAIALSALLLVIGAASALAAFPQDPPNDPGYDRAEEQPNQ